MNKLTLLLWVCLVGTSFLYSSNAVPEDKSCSLRLELTGIEITGINLASEVVDIKIQSLEVKAGCPFEGVMSRHTRQGREHRSLESLESSYNKSYGPYSLKIPGPWNYVATRTVPWSINIFPFEAYESEIVFGFNSTNFQTLILDYCPTLSPSLEREAKWNVSACFRETENTWSKLPDWENIKSRYQNWTFRSLIITISHPAPYQLKMSIPTWGISLFLILLLILQFGPLRSKLENDHHIAMFIGASIFSAGQVIAVLEILPPQVTFAQLLLSTLPPLHLVLLAVLIRGKSSQACQRRSERHDYVANPQLAALVVALFAMVIVIGSWGMHAKKKRDGMAK